MTLFDQEVLSARKREQATAPKIRAANVLGDLKHYRLFSYFYEYIISFTTSAQKRCLRHCATECCRGHGSGDDDNDDVELAPRDGSSGSSSAPLPWDASG